MRRFLVALGFLTILPIPKGSQMPQRTSELADSIVYFPIVGLVLGIILILVRVILKCVLPESLIDLILIFLLIVLTGGIHMDGLADTADGLFSGISDREKVMDIMRDSRIGTMGLIAVVGAILLKYALLSNIPTHMKNYAMILMCTSGRWAQVMSAYCFQSAHKTGKGGLFIGHINKVKFKVSTALFVLICLGLWQVKSILLLFFVPTFNYILSAMISERLDGITGDILGALDEIIEIMALFIIMVIS